MYNKSNVIDYMILLKLIMNNKNIYMPNNFYVEWVSYLIPTIDKKTRIKCKIREIIPRYNIKNNILQLLKRLQCDENMNVNIYFTNNEHEHIIDENKDIQRLHINIIKNIFLYSVKFTFEIPKKSFSYIKSINWTFHKFNIFMIDIWEEYYGLIMDDYMISTYLKKLIYYIFFKKIFIRSIESVQTT